MKITIIILILLFFRNTVLSAQEVDRTLLLEDIQLEGKKRLKAQDFIRGIQKNISIVK